MSDDAITPNTQQTTSGQPPSEPQHGRGLWNSGFKVEDDAPVADHWKGKTAKEILAEAERIRQEAAEWKGLAMNAMPQQQQNYQQPAQPQAFSYQQPTYPSANLMLENPAEYDRQMQAYISYTNQQTAQQTLQQASQFITPQLSSTGKYMSQMDPRHKDIWDRYGSEIELTMAKSGLQPIQQTKEAWDTVVRFVKADHVDELAYEKAQKLQQSGGFGTEGASNAGAAPSLQSDPLSTFWSSDHPWVKRAKDTGMSIADVRKHIASQQLTEQQWVEDMSKGRSFSAEAA